MQKGVYLRYRDDDDDDDDDRKGAQGERGTHTENQRSGKLRGLSDRAAHAKPKSLPNLAGEGWPSKRNFLGLRRLPFLAHLHYFLYHTYAHLHV